MDIYEAFKRQHPELFKQPAVNNKRKLTAKNQPAEKR
jgi:hypothetical protein